MNKAPESGVPTKPLPRRLEPVQNDSSGIQKKKLIKNKEQKKVKKYALDVEESPSSESSQFYKV